MENATRRQRQNESHESQCHRTFVRSPSTFGSHNNEESCKASLILDSKTWERRAGVWKLGHQYCGNKKGSRKLAGGWYEGRGSCLIFVEKGNKCGRASGFDRCWKNIVYFATSISVPCPLNHYADHCK
jgi:hypothetical protein